MLRPILLRWPPIRLLLLLIDQVAGKEDLFRGDAGRPAHQTQWAGWGPSWLICLSYGFGLYQSLERSFVALVKLDWRPGRSSSDDAPCPEECPVGLKFTSLSNKTTYEPCPKGQEIAFQQCPASFKTTLSGSVTAEEWTEPNGVFSFQGKHLCPLSGRDLPARSPKGVSCLACLPDSTTKMAGATLKTIAPILAVLPATRRSAPPKESASLWLPPMSSYANASPSRPSRPTVPSTSSVWTGATIYARTTAMHCHVLPMHRQLHRPAMWDPVQLCLHCRRNCWWVLLY